MISVITPVLVTYVIAIVSTYVGSQEIPSIRNNLNLCYLLFIFPKKNYSDSDSDSYAYFSRPPIKINVPKNTDMNMAENAYFLSLLMGLRSHNTCNQGNKYMEICRTILCTNIWNLFYEGVRV